MKELIFALEQTIKYLEKSGEDALSAHTPKEIIEILQNEIQSIESGQNFLTDEIYIMYLPTASLGDIAIFNGWGDEYIKLAEVIDKFKR